MWASPPREDIGEWLQGVGRETKECEDHRDKTLQEDRVTYLKMRGNLGKVLGRTRFGSKILS